MPLPLILGAAALVTAAYGAKKGYDGYQKHSEADDIVKDAKYRYERKKNSFDEKEKETTLALDLLGKKELEIGGSIGEFKTLADALLKKLNSGRKNKLDISIPKHKLQKIEDYSCTAVGVMAAAMGAASTGTVISALSGTAATKATLAALGGGSMVTGGTAILGAAVAAPVLAIAGWAYDSHGEEALKNARKASNEVSLAIEKMDRAHQQLEDTIDYSQKIKRSLVSIFGQFQKYFDELKSVNAFLEDVKGRGVDVDSEMEKLGGDVIRVIENGYALASILVDVITTPLFKIKKINGEVVRNGDGVPEMEKDADGSMILNGAELDAALRKAKNEASDVGDVR